MANWLVQCPFGAKLVWDRISVIDPNSFPRPTLFLFFYKFFNDNATFKKKKLIIIIINNPPSPKQQQTKTT